MCALSMRQSTLGEEENPREAGGLAKPLDWSPLEERSLAKGKTLGEASPGMGSLSRLGEPRQAWRAWFLAKFSNE